MIKLQLEYLPAVNYSLINNRIGVCQSVEIINDSTDDVRNIVIECSGEFFQNTRSTVIDVIKANKSVRLQGIEYLYTSESGFTRRGKNVDQALNEALEMLISSSRITESEGMLRLPNE